MLNPISCTKIDFLKKKQNISFCQNSKSAEIPAQNSQQGFPLQSFSSEHSRANYLPIKNISGISFGSVLNLPTKEITPKDVITKFNDQLNIISPEKIQKIIDSFDESDRPMASKIMQKMTQFGNMQSLNEIAKHVKKNKGNFYYKRDLIDLSTIIQYLSDKDAFGGVIGEFGSTKNSYILDETALEELEKNKNHLEKIKNTPNLRIIYPEGWINGINPFNQAEAIREKVQKLIPRVKELQTEKTMDDAISTALNEDIVERIKKLGLFDKLEIIKNKEIKNASSTAKQISKQLAPASMKEEDLAQVINKLPEDSRKLMLDYLMNNADIYSPRRLSVSLKKLHNEFKRKGMITEGTYYYVPESKKSYGMISMMYKLANGIPNDRFIYDDNLEDIPENANRIIVLDDVAGTGLSLTGDKQYLRRKNFKGQITIAPTISTYKAAAVLSRERMKNTFFPYKIKNSLKDSDYFKFLNESEKKILLKELNGLGYSHEGLGIVFPYMSPDNNNIFFAENIAPNFTLNRKGVKKKVYNEN